MYDTERTNIATNKRPTAIPGLTFATLSFALSRGLTFEALEGATGLDRRALVAADSRMPEDTAPRIWRLISDKAGPNEVPSVTMARATPFSFLGGLVEAAHFASTLREALHFFIENRTYISGSLSLEVHDSPETGEMSVISEHPLSVLDGGRMIEVGTGLASRIVATLLHKDVKPRRVDFRHAQAGALEVYQSALRAPTRFDQPLSQIVFDRSLLDARVHAANLELFEYVRTHFQLARAQLDEEGVPEELRRLRQAILESAASGDYRAGAVAARAGVSVRSAQRKAAAHGTTLSSMIDTVRRADAERLVEDLSLSLEAVASLIGYSDDRAFRRAFKAWTGQSPSAYRRQRRNGLKN
ncbi:MAG: AraC family transcriptional regulator ligand-binding domain-containing protein [Pseudomonadota bacterium]